MRYIANIKSNRAASRDLGFVIANHFHYIAAYYYIAARVAIFDFLNNFFNNLRYILQIPKSPYLISFIQCLISDSLGYI